MHRLNKLSITAAVFRPSGAFWSHIALMKAAGLSLPGSNTPSDLWLQSRLPKCPHKKATSHLEQSADTLLHMTAANTRVRAVWAPRRCWPLSGWSPFHSLADPCLCSSVVNQPYRLGGRRSISWTPSTVKANQNMGVHELSLHSSAAVPNLPSSPTLAPPQNFLPGNRNKERCLIFPASALKVLLKRLDTVCTRQLSQKYHLASLSPAKGEEQK